MRCNLACRSQEREELREARRVASGYTTSLANHLRRWRNDPRVWANTGSHPDREVTEAMELDWIRKVLADPTRRNFAIVLKDGDRYVGNVYLTNIRNGVGEQGTFIGEVGLWGKGIGSRTRDALAKIAKEELGLRAIKSRLRVENVASLKSNLRIGFREVSRDEEYVYLERILCAASLGYAKG